MYIACYTVKEEYEIQCSTVQYSIVHDIAEGTQGKAHGAANSRTRRLRDHRAVHDREWFSTPGLKPSVEPLACSTELLRFEQAGTCYQCNKENILCTTIKAEQNQAQSIYDTCFKGRLTVML